MMLSCYGTEPLIAERNREHGSGLGIFRLVVGGTLSWLHQHRRLRIRYERLGDIHEAFLTIGCALICWNMLNHGFCWTLLLTFESAM